MMDILGAIIETSYNTILLNSKRSQNKGVNCPISKAIPGWRENVEPLRQDSLFWYNMWVLFIAYG